MGRREAFESSIPALQAALAADPHDKDDEIAFTGSGRVHGKYRGVYADKRADGSSAYSALRVVRTTKLSGGVQPSEEAAARISDLITVCVYHHEGKKGVEDKLNFSVSRGAARWAIGLTPEKLCSAVQRQRAAKGCSSQYVGVRRNLDQPDRPWTARAGGWSKSFANEEDAARARDQEAHRRFGSCRRVKYNFPEVFAEQPSTSATSSSSSSSDDEAMAAATRSYEARIEPLASFLTAHPRDDDGKIGYRGGPPIPPGGKYKCVKPYTQTVSGQEMFFAFVAFEGQQPPVLCGGTQPNAEDAARDADLFRAWRKLSKPPNGMVSKQPIRFNFDVSKGALRWLRTVTAVQLRDALQSDSSLKQQRQQSSRYLGVRRRQNLTTVTWRAWVGHDGGETELGTFATEEEAARAYDKAARKLKGSGTRLNFPGEAQDEDDGQEEDVPVAENAEPQSDEDGEESDDGEGEDEEADAEEGDEEKVPCPASAAEMDEDDDDGEEDGDNEDEDEEVEEDVLAAFTAEMERDDDDGAEDEDEDEDDDEDEDEDEDDETETSSQAIAGGSHTAGGTSATGGTCMAERRVSSRPKPWQEPWACERCTTENVFTRHTCASCGHPRKKSGSGAASRPSITAGSKHGSDDLMPTDSKAAKKAAAATPSAGLTPAGAAAATAAVPSAGPSSGLRLRNRPPWVLLGSRLNSDQQDILRGFAEQTGSHVVEAWSPQVTHVICAADTDKRVHRTPKVLMGCAAGCWVLSLAWAVSSINNNVLAAEDKYEIHADRAGNLDGTRIGRQRRLLDAPPLLAGHQVILAGAFEDSESDFRVLLETCGAKVVDHLPSSAATSAETSARKAAARTLTRAASMAAAIGPSGSSALAGRSDGKCSGLLVLVAQKELVNLETTWSGALVQLLRDAAASGVEALIDRWLVDSVGRGTLQPTSRYVVHAPPWAEVDGAA